MGCEYFFFVEMRYMTMDTFFIYLLTAILLYISYSVPLPVRFSKLKKTALFLFSFFVVALLSSYGQITAALGSCIIYTVILCLSPSGHRLLCLCCSVWGHMCCVITNHLCQILADLLFHFSTAELELHHFYSFTVVNIVILYAILLVFRFLFHKKWRLAEMKISGKILFAILFSLIVCEAIFTANFTYGEQIGYPAFIIRLNAVLFLILFAVAGFLLFLIITEMQQNHAYQTRLEYLQATQEYSEALNTSYQELLKFKHDYKNLLLGLSGYLESEDISGMKKYFSQTLQPFSEKIEHTFDQSSFLVFLEIPEVRGLCLAKAAQAQERGIKVNFFVSSPVTSLHMDIIDFLRILGIYFDNAIEAAEVSAEKQIEFRLFPEDGGWTLTLANSYKDASLTLEKLSTPGYTTKGADHGKGLSIVRDIFKRYPDIVHTTRLRDGYLIQEIH